MGKTSLLLNAAVGWARSDHRPQFFSLTASKAETEKRLASLIAEKRIEDIERRHLADVESLGITVYDGPDVDIGYLERKAEKDGGPILIDTINHLEDFADTTPSRRTDSLGAIMRRLKRLAKRHETIVVVSAFLPQPAPELSERDSDFDRRFLALKTKESTYIADYADSVFYIWREEVVEEARKPSECDSEVYSNEMTDWFERMEKIHGLAFIRCVKGYRAFGRRELRFEPLFSRWTEPAVRCFSNKGAE